MKDGYTHVRLPRGMQSQKPGSMQSCSAGSAQGHAAARRHSNTQLMRSPVMGCGVRHWSGGQITVCRLSCRHTPQPPLGCLCAAAGHAPVTLTPIGRRRQALGTALLRFA